VTVISHCQPLILASHDNNPYTGLTLGDCALRLQMPTLSFRFSVVRQGRPTVTILHTPAIQVAGNIYIREKGSISCL